MDPCKFKSRCCIEARKRVVMGHHTHATFSDSKAWPVCTMGHDSVNYRSMEDWVNKSVDATATTPGSMGHGWMNWGARGMERNTLEGDGHPTLLGLQGHCVEVRRSTRV